MFCVGQVVQVAPHKGSDAKKEPDRRVKKPLRWSLAAHPRVTPTLWCLGAGCEFNCFGWPRVLFYLLCWVPFEIVFQGSRRELLNTFEKKRRIQDRRWVSLVPPLGTFWVTREAEGKTEHRSIC